MDRWGVRSIRWTEIVHTFEPDPVMVFWPIWCGSVSTLIDAGNCAVIGNGVHSTRARHPSVGGVEMTTHKRA